MLQEISTTSNYQTQMLMTSSTELLHKDRKFSQGQKTIDTTHYPAPTPSKALTMLWWMMR